jgi:ATP-dependent RNA helicase RhlB
VIVATPGRLKDFIQKKVVNISDTKLFICDEADRMFDMGFIEDVKFFLNKLTEGCQKLLFSATTNDSVRELAFEYLDKPEYISAQPDSITPEKIQQHAIICESVNKFKVILSLLRRDKPNCSIVFTNTKAAAEWLHFKLNGNGLDTDLITGDLPQRKRIALIKRIKEGEVKALIATDVASRGLHIGAVTHVYNFDLPNEASNYVHRIGRTARAGATGTAISLVCEDYGENLRAINTLLGPLAMKSEWYDPSFLEVTDLAGSPPRAARREGSGGDRGQQRRSGGGDRHRGPSGQNRGRPQGPRGAGPQRGDRPTNRQEHASGASAERHGRPQRPQQTADQRRSGPSSRPQHQQQNRPNRPGQQQQHQQRPKPVQPPMTATKKVPIPEQKTGFVSLVKKLVKTIFG